VYLGSVPRLVERRWALRLSTAITYTGPTVFMAFAVTPLINHYAVSSSVLLTNADPIWVSEMSAVPNAHEIHNGPPGQAHATGDGGPGANPHGQSEPEHHPQRYYRRVIRIRAEDSPNVRYALAEIARGLNPSGRMLVPGVLSWHECAKRRATWDKVRQCIGLDAEFYEGAEFLLFPPLWLAGSERRAAELDLTTHRSKRQPVAIGIDPGEGSARTSMSAVDYHGLVDLVSRPTPDTNVIVREAIDFMHAHCVRPEKLMFDRGGGGKQHADRMRAMGYPVKTVAFGEAVTPDIRRGLRRIDERVEAQEERYVYLNRRAEMYGTLRELIDPARDVPVFALPAEYTVLRRQLSPIPLMFDAEGRLKLPPKNRTSAESNITTLTELIGESPDEADSLVVAIYAMYHKPTKVRAGAAL
jgi:hypothetical protein